MRLILALTGGSGVQYGLRLLQVLHQQNHIIDLVVSNGARKVMEVEVGKDAMQILTLADHTYNNDDIGAKIASGTHPNDGMVIVPCSMNTLAAIANGITINLIQRAADCTLKEGRRLVVVPRETPLNLIHLKNMKQLKEAGADILPASPGFYNRPKTIEDRIDFIVAKILNLLGLQHELMTSWSPPW